MLAFSLRAFPLALLIIFVAANLSGSPSAVPYKIFPLKTVHETMTLMASDCLRAAPAEARPTICLQSPAVVMDNTVLNDAFLDLNSIGLGIVTRKELAKVVKWPDDPTSQIAGPTIATLGITLLTKCKTFSGELKQSLLCRSHFGELQFWHAMASSPTEPTVETQRKIVGWAEFLYDVAAGGDLTRNYCDYWRAQEQLEGKGELARALAPADGFPCTKSGPPWTIGTLFSLKCKNPFSDKADCTESFDPRNARIQALGALLHLVQDSFAQGHAARGSCAIDAETRQVTSKFECLPIRQFYSYSAQDAKKHAQADAPPELGRSCANASTMVDEPILASATVLWFIKEKQGSAALAEYLKERVFPLAADHLPRAGPGECFAKAL